MKSRPSEVDRLAAIAAIDAEIERLMSEREVLTIEVADCRGCNESTLTSDLNGAGECSACTDGDPTDPDAEHRENFYASIASGCI